MVVIAHYWAPSVATLTLVRRWSIRLAKLSCSRMSFALARLARIAQRPCAVPFPVASEEKFAVLLEHATSARALAQLAGFAHCADSQSTRSTRFFSFVPAEFSALLTHNGGEMFDSSPPSASRSLNLNVGARRPSP